MRKLAYKRNAGNYGENSVAYTNIEDVELLNKLGFNMNPSSYLFLARGEHPENIYTYIEKAAGIPESVSKAIDNDEPFSAEYLKDLDYTVPKGYEVKGDLVVPLEKEAEANHPLTSSNIKTGAKIDKLLRSLPVGEKLSKIFTDQTRKIHGLHPGISVHEITPDKAVQNLRAIRKFTPQETLIPYGSEDYKNAWRDIKNNNFIHLEHGTDRLAAESIMKYGPSGKMGTPDHTDAMLDLLWNFRRNRPRNMPAFIASRYDNNIIFANPQGTQRTLEYAKGSNGSGGIAPSALRFSLPASLVHNTPNTEYRIGREVFNRFARNKRVEPISENLMVPKIPQIAGNSNIKSNNYIEKEASDILPHQQRIVEKLEQEDQPGLILMHGLGSGKTRSSIEAYKKLGLPAEVIVPAALKENYRKELKKWLGKAPKNVDIKSQQEVARKGLSSDIEDKLMIIDEAHRLRNAGNKLYQSISKANPKKRLLLTGTPVYNHPSDIAPLINLAAGEDILPTTRAVFEDKFIEYKDKPQSFKEKIMGLTPAQEINIKNKNKLRSILQKYIDYHGGQSSDFPETSYEHISVPMNERQTEIYKTLIKDLPWLLRKKVEMGLAPQRKELDKLMPFLTGGRMISNSTRGFEADPANVRSPKIEKAFEYLKKQLAKDPEYKALVYSNYLDSGVNEYKKLLEREEIPYGEFTGDVKDRLRDQMIKDYNANKLKALLVSSAGGEGLDLKGTRLVQILEPHFNNEKLKQVIGRAARFKSHEGLSPEKKKVLVQHYLSSLSPSWLEKKFGGKTTTTDEYLQSIADEKERLNNEIIKLIKTK